MHNRSKSARSARWASPYFAAGLLLAGCSEALPGGAGEERSGPVALSGSVEKGPFIIGSSISIAALTAAGDPTGEVFGTSTHSDLGEFEVNLDAAGPVALEGEGFYYNEILGGLSDAPLTLRGLTEAGGSAATAHLNVVTHLAHERARALMGTGLSASAALTQAEGELRAALGFSPPGFDPQVAGAGMSIFGGDAPANGYLLAVGATILMVAVEEAGDEEPLDATLQRSLNALAFDLADDGALDPEVVAVLEDASDRLDRYDLLDRLEVRLEEIGASAVLPDLDPFLDIDDDGVFDEQDNCRRIPNADQAPLLAVCSMTKVSSPRPDTSFTGYSLLDADQDGHTDVVVTGGGGDLGIGVLLGDGTGKLAPPVWSATTSTTQQALQGDFNEDGDPDLVLNQGDLRLALGGPGASFGWPAQIYDWLAGPTAIGDINGDGHLDVVATERSTVPVWGAGVGVVRLLGNGAGSFSPQAQFTTVYTKAVALGRFNGDGALDLVIGHGDPKIVSLWLNDGAGNFNVVQTFPLGEVPESLVRGDWNGDGVDDVGVLTTSGRTMLLLGTGGAGYFTLGPQRAVAPSCTWGQLAFRDLTGDGRDDLVATCPDSVTLDVLVSASQSVSEHFELPKAGSWNSQDLADMNGDGRLDLVYDSGDRMVVQLLNL